MYFKRLDPDSPASRGDLEALLGAHADCLLWTEAVTRHSADFIEAPFESRRDCLLKSCDLLIKAYRRLQEVEESISPTPREGA